MNEARDRQREASTCLEGLPAAEMMEKLGPEQGIGSLCEEMMRSSRKATEVKIKAENPMNRRNNMIESVMKLHSCANCSIRCRASRKPRSLSARIHRWHATWWPGWKYYQAELGVRGAKAMPRA